MSEHKKSSGSKNHILRPSNSNSESLLAMNPRKSEDDDPFFHHFHHTHYEDHHRRQIMDAQDQSQPSIHDPPFSLMFRDTDEENDSLTPSDDDPDDIALPVAAADTTSPYPALTLADSTRSDAATTLDCFNPAYINPEPHISSQFYTFNRESHALMIKCLFDGRLATPAEIRAATPPEVLKSWRAVWKDRNEDTAYITAWKRIQDKLQVHVDKDGNQFLCFKNNSQQFVSHVNQWQEIVMSFHGDTDLKHLGLKETIDRIKQVWTVGAKFYGIPESFIRVCITACPVCSRPGDGGSGIGCSAGRPKRRRFEYTESFDVPAKEVPNKLQQLARKHKVVLCIRQKYIRYKPFMAEVKDYACHRAGEPATKKSKILKREPYASKRCGCGFRIRAIVPIANYNEKDKTFVYQEEGMAIFKLYAVHTGHDPGPLDGNARIMHRVVGHKGVFFLDQEEEYGVNEDIENGIFSTVARDKGEFYLTALQRVQDLKNELGLLEGRILKVPSELMGALSQELHDIVNKVRMLRGEASQPGRLLCEKPHSEVMLIGAGELGHWSDPNEETLYGDGKETDLIEEDEDSFGQTLGDIVPWDQMREECETQKDMISEPCKAEKWLNGSEFDKKSILECENSKQTKPMRHDDNIEADVGLVGIQVDSFYPENPKLYDSPCGLDTSRDCGDSGFRHGEIGRRRRAALEYCFQRFERVKVLCLSDSIVHLVGGSSISSKFDHWEIGNFYGGKD
ncbi:hypothetical protein Nepgr_024354 [Nepenthes gracilis]|uniref:Uncharacterized protein n=1 Tax=Nepenthes gracilis TaxID=150966 RepID=A0AAD3T4I4_NEPGR|nr:hypothetical protein Nepgr_024354 [Nepenthes gracilis]